MNAALRAAACLVQLCGGFVLWSSCFVVLYALLSLGCEAGGGAWLRVVLGVAWLLHLAALGALLAWQWARRPGAGRPPLPGLPPSLHRVALAASAAALLGTVWIGWPVLALPPCAGPELPAARATP